MKNASGPQLWRLNQAGRLRITDEEGTPIDFTEAWELVSELAAGRANAANGSGTQKASA